jgi:hypothetical protein
VRPSVRVLIHVVLPLTLGVVAYVAWRETEVRIVTWMPRAIITLLRGTLGRIPLPRVVSGSLPDAAWGWAFGAALGLVWRTRGWREKAPWILTGAVMTAGVEIGQAVGVIPGVFDWIDLVSMVIGYALGAIISSGTAHLPSHRQRSSTSDRG